MNLLRSQPGHHLQNLDDVLDDLNSRFGICFNESERKSFQKNVREKYIDALVCNINSRFSDVGVVHALASLLDPQKATQVYQALSDSDFNNNYGMADIATTSVSL